MHLIFVQRGNKQKRQGTGRKYAYRKGRDQARKVGPQGGKRKGRQRTGKEGREQARR